MTPRWALDSRDKIQQAFDDHNARLAKRDRDMRSDAYDMAAIPILREMAKLRSIYEVVPPIVVKPGATLADWQISPDQIKFVLPPDAQKLYDAYADALRKLRELYPDI